MAQCLLQISRAAMTLLLLISLPASARPSPITGPPRVHKPFNLTMTSYNYNTTFCWDYNSSSVIPYFQVEITDFKTGNRTMVDSCNMIPHHCCDVSKITVDISTFYDLKVKAFVGTQRSEYAKIREFSLLYDVTYGPPSMNASVQDKKILVDIWHPYVPFIDEKKTLADYFSDLKYRIYYGNETEVIENCDEIACTAEILTAKFEGNYCISAMGMSETVPVIFEKSKEICIDLAAYREPSYQMVIIITAITSSLLVFIVLVLCVFRKKTETKANVPESLRAVVRSVAPRLTFLEPKTKYDHVSITPLESPEEKPIETEDANLDRSHSSQSVSGVSATGYPAYQGSLSESENKPDADQDGCAEEEEPGSSTYSHTNNNNNDTTGSSFTTESETSEKAESKQEPTRVVIPVTQSFGYDKPHAPLDIDI